MTAEKMTKEETDLLDELNGKSANAGPSMPYLSINIASEDKDGKEIPVKTFHLSDTDLYSKTVKFRPFAFYNKLIAMKQDEKKAWKTINETIMYRMLEQPIDARGGVACGRLMGKAIPTTWTEEQLRANKAKANYYGFLFGTVQFPGSEPVLCNFRVPGGKAVQVNNVLKDLDTNHGGFQQYAVNMTLKSNSKDKASPHPIIDIEPDVGTVLPRSGNLKDLTAIKGYVDAHNKRIRDSHKSVVMARAGEVADTETVAHVLGEDSIPF